MQLPWPDESMRQGDAEAIVGFVGSPEVATVRAVLRRDARALARAQTHCRSAGRAGQYRSRGRARRKRRDRQRAWTQRLRGGGAIIAEAPLMTRGHDALRRGGYRADLVGWELSQRRSAGASSSPTLTSSLG
jgi:hypothetical protein